MESPTTHFPVAVGGASDAAIEALLAVLRPLTRLAIDHGVQFNQLMELTKRAMVDSAARAVEPESGDDAPPVSRLSVITGIHRKEVKRLVGSDDLTAVRSEKTPATVLFLRWSTDPAMLEPDGGAPRVLPRRPPQDGGPSFESLARSVTTDVHPRTLLDELQRLALVEHDPVADVVRLRRDSFVPQGRIDELLAFVGANVGDHLAAARDNVAAGQRLAAGDTTAKPPFIEQALFFDALSAESVAAAGARARAFWTRLLKALGPELQTLEDTDRAAGRVNDQRIRIGLYFYSEAMPGPSDGPRTAPSEAP